MLGAVVHVHREAGVGELVFYWPVDHATFEPTPALEDALERIAMETVPGLRRTGPAEAQRE